MARAWVFSNDVNTDEIIAGRYLVEPDPNELAKHVMESIDPKFVTKVRKGDIIIAGRNFGCGSSREQAPIALKAAGISSIVADSFARIFFRNAINQGLPVLVCKGVRKGFKSGQRVKVDLREGTLKNLETGKTFKFEPLPRFVLDILRAGGMLPYLRRSDIKRGRTGAEIL